MLSKIQDKLKTPWQSDLLIVVSEWESHLQGEGVNVNIAACNRHIVRTKSGLNQQ